MVMERGERQMYVGQLADRFELRDIFRTSFCQEGVSTAFRR